MLWSEPLVLVDEANFINFLITGPQLPWVPEVLFFFREERAVKTERRQISFFPLEVARYLIDHAKEKKTLWHPGYTNTYQVIKWKTFYSMVTTIYPLNKWSAVCQSILATHGWP